MMDWTRQPLEIARFLDGELTAEERRSCEALLTSDSAAKARVSREASFLALVRSARAAEPQVPPGLAERVRAALAADRAAGSAPVVSIAAARRRRRWAALSVAAALLVAATVWTVAGRARETQAADRPVLLAAEALLRATDGAAPATPGLSPACGERETASPHRFPPVLNGDFELRDCRKVEGQDASTSVLRREGAPNDVRGLVVVPQTGRSTSEDVGYTLLDGDVVVFDVTIGNARYFLATRWSAVVGTTSCAACHGPDRAAHPEKNPHHIFERPLAR